MMGITWIFNEYPTMLSIRHPYLVRSSIIVFSGLLTRAATSSGSKSRVVSTELDKSAGRTVTMRIPL